MIRTTAEAAVFGLWRDAAVLDALAHTALLTTARYEPVSRNLLGSGYLDLLFENPDQSCIIGGIRLDPNSLITRERSPFVWPVHLVRLLDGGRLLTIESFLTPWLRSLARARPMAQEALRRYRSSQRFDRARAAELLGAAPLERVMRRMAPFVYARRFAAGSRVSIDCADGPLGYALLDELVASITEVDGGVTEAASGERAFARAWYGIRARGLPAPSGIVDLALVERRGSSAAPILIETSPETGSPGAAVEVPSPAPLDVLFTFDAADAPSIARFTVHAAEPPLRARPPLARPDVFGDSSGRIVLALSLAARATHGADVDEVETLKRCLENEGLCATIVTDVSDAAMAAAELVHVFGAAAEPHTVAFGEAARERGTAVVFDLPPRALCASEYLESMLVVALRAASDDAESARYLQAYEQRRATGATAAEPSAEQFAQNEERFAGLATGALAVLVDEADLELTRACLPEAAAQRVLARGVFASAEPSPGAIGHLVPSPPFALVHAPIGARSHALFAAYAAQSRRVPLVIAGPCVDVEYLQTLRTIAPDAVVLADPAAGIIAALYRCAAVWIDAAPRPRSAAWLVRAAACGALPVLAEESPLARIAGAGIPTFKLTSFDDCAATLVEAMASSDRDERVAGLRARLAPRRDLARSFSGLMAAYARVTTAV